jgi:hypothetical protein
MQVNFGAFNLNTISKQHESMQVSAITRRSGGLRSWTPTSSVTQKHST